MEDIYKNETEILVSSLKFNKITYLLTSHTSQTSKKDDQNFQMSSA